MIENPLDLLADDCPELTASMKSGDEGA